jgi:hypothetical protein
MKIIKNQFFYPVIFTFLSIFFCTIVWDNITLPYNHDNTHEIVGEYSLNEHNSFNDTLRYIIFISIPVISFLIIFLLTKNNQKFHNLTINILYLDKNFEKTKYSKIYLLSFILISIILFILDDWKIGQLQIFEDGISLSGSTMFEFKKKPWVDVYINTGFFYDMLNAKISWILTGYETIGSFKFYIKFLNLISLILLIYFIHEITSQISKKAIHKQFFFLSTISLFFILKDVDIWRDIPLVVFLICVLKYINSKSFYLIITICFLTFFTFFWSLDRGFFLFFTLIPFLLLILINDKKEFFKFVASIFLFMIIIFFTMGSETFLSFLNHTEEILTQHELLNGIIHPSPFSEDKNSMRATKSLILIILNFIISLILLFSKKNFFLNNSKFIFIFFSILNFLIYKSALSRSDGGHIKMATYFSIILFVIFITYLILDYLNRKPIFIKNIPKLNYIFICMTSVFLTYYIFTFGDFNSALKKLKKFISAEDIFFVNKSYMDSIKNLKPFFDNSDCIQAFSYDQAIFYLLKKRSCSKFYNVWVIGSKKNQLTYIDELKLNKPQFILKGGITKFQPLNERYPYIENFIKKEYFIYDQVDQWIVLKLNN